MHNLFVVVKQKLHQLWLRTYQVMTRGNWQLVLVMVQDVGLIVVWWLKMEPQNSQLYYLSIVRSADNSYNLLPPLAVFTLLGGQSMDILQKPE